PLFPTSPLPDALPIYGRVVSRRQPESAHEAFSRVCAPISKGCGLDPLTALQGEERPRFRRPHDDRLASDGPEAQDLRAHEPSPRSEEHTSELQSPDHL